MKEQFIKFLKKNRCYKRFISNYTSFSWTLDEYIKEGDPEKLISGAFLYPFEEIKFWDGMSKKWQKQLNKN